MSITIKIFRIPIRFTVYKEGNKYHLIAGYLRFRAAAELGWKTIKANVYTKISRIERKLIEIAENNNRQNFSNFEFYDGLKQLKYEFEKIKKNKSHLQKSDLGSVFSIFEIDFSHSFVTAFYKILGFHPRILRRKVRILNAMENELIDTETLKLFENVMISEKGLLTILKEKGMQQLQAEDELRKKKNKQIINPKLNPYIGEKDSKEQEDYIKKLGESALESFKEIEKPSFENQLNKDTRIGEAHSTQTQILETSTRSKKFSRKSTEAPEAKNKTLEEKKDVVLKIRKEIVESFINSGKDIITSQKNKTPIKKTLLSQPEKDVDKPSIGNESFTLKNNLSSISFENSSMEDICFNCPKATVLAIKCKSCGGYTKKVHCKIDFIENRHILRDPSLPLCENALDSEFRLPDPNLLPC
ncbi:hypothetical protein LCGC14_1231970 [marine sediment metagenome]|uniref:ParB/Sulfiredoxin domain-containing protein n=1 Tax=marine sediment metagenome TaxID=412755 RepID=A0A0F9L8B3_9ZZZZ|nr:MAG: hypothetical protein Lokiarch_22720 [Candidatus Lokiarchaeum sp. GC14_75]